MMPLRLEMPVCHRSSHFSRAFAPLVTSLLLCVVAGCQGPVPGNPQDGSAAGTAAGRAAALSGLETRDVQPVTVNYPESGVDIGWGWDTEAGVPRPTVCVEFSIAEDKGQTKYMTITEVSDSRELMQSMNISAAASVKTIAYQASGKANFATNTRINSFSSNFVLNASVDNGVRYAAPREAGARPVVRNAEDQQVIPDAGSIHLTGAALRLAQQRDLDAFLDTCGDSFVAALYGGANLTAVLTVAETSREQQQKIATEFTGSGWGAKVRAAASAEGEDNEMSSKLSMRFYQTGGRKDAIPATKADFVKKLDSLSTDAGEFPATYRVSLLPYTALANWPARDIELSTDEQEQLAHYWAAYAAIYSDIQYILDQPGDFQQLTAAQAFAAVDVKALQALQDEVHAGMRRLRDAALRCAEPDPGPEEVCSFDERAYLDPLAYRIRMPVPVAADSPVDAACACRRLPSTASGADAARVVADYYVRDPNRSDCRNNPLAATCLSNAEIDRWQARVGRRLVALPDSSAATRLRKIQAAGIAACGATDDEAACLSGYDWFEVQESPAYVWVDGKRTGQDADPLRLLD